LNVALWGISDQAMMCVRKIAAFIRREDHQVAIKSFGCYFQVPGIPQVIDERLIRGSR
jgi:hypothetical protein